MILKPTLFTAVCTLAAVAFAQSEIPIDNNQPPTPSSTKERFAPPFTGGKPGDLLSQKEIGTDIKGARAWKVRYISKDVNDVLHEVSGVVIAPKEKGKDRRVMTWCHGTTGLGDASCPSAQPNSARELITYYDVTSTQQIDYGVPGLQGFIDDGYVVCATDYQGQGSPGQHQYEVNRTQARDAVNLVHAARKLDDVAAGTKFGCAGWSQGGGAAAAVTELDATDYGDLKLVGSVPMSPVTTATIFGFPTGPSAARLDSSKPPEVHVAMMLAGLQIANPDKLQLSDYFTPLGVEIIETAWNIQPVHHLGDTIDRLHLLKGPVTQAKPTNLDHWKEVVAAASGGTRKAVAPMLLCVDNGTLNPLPWQQSLADQVKELGGTIETKSYPNDDHFSLPNSCAPDARKWLNNLF
jgi:hypothetical protein